MYYWYHVLSATQEFNSKLQSFKVSKFQSSKVSNFRNSKVPKFQSLKVPKFQCCKVPKFQSSEIPKVQTSILCFRKYWSHITKMPCHVFWQILTPCYQTSISCFKDIDPTFKIFKKSISCFLIDIDLIFQIFKNFLNGSSGFVGARLFPKNTNVDFHKLEISPKRFSPNEFVLLFYLLKYLGIPKSRIIGFGNDGHVW